jgi:hypothetical protein
LEEFNYHMRKLTALTALLAAPGFPAAVYTTHVGSTFGIGPIAIVEAGPSGLIPAPFTIGAGTAGGGGIVSPDGVKPATIDSGVTGAAPGPVSLATSTFIAGHIFRIDNSTGLSPIVAAFTFDYFWDVTLSADTPGVDFASGGGFFHITGIDNEVLTVGGVVVAEYLVHRTFDTAGGGTGGAGTGFITGSITVPAGVISVFSVITDTTGAASSVPEPAGLAWTSLLLIAAAAFRRR